MSDRILALFAKRPEPGLVKTRLSPPLSMAQAAALYEAMLLDILDQHAASKDWERALWYTPSGSRDYFEGVAPAGYRLCEQRGEGLAGRMAELFRVHHDEGYRAVVLRGTDSPTLPAERIAEAFRELERMDLVLCPDRDGGYNLIGLRQPCDALFQLETSTPDLLDETLACARAQGLDAHLLAPHYDVDCADDLALLRKDVCEAQTPRTRRWIEESRVKMTW